MVVVRGGSEGKWMEERQQTMNEQIKWVAACLLTRKKWRTNEDR
jgi:hypothetical protein